MTTPYTYCITHLPTGNWYHGVRYARGCQPSDLWVTYFTSSTAVLNLVKTGTPQDFRAEVRRTFSSRNEAIAWEARVNRRIIKRKNVINECAWPAVSEEAQERSKVSRAMIGEDGLSPAQRAGIRWKIKKNEVDPTSGKTYGELRRMRYNQAIDREAMSKRSKEWHLKNENPTKRPEVRAKISNTLKAGIADGTIKTTKGMKISKISEALKGNTAVKGYKWYNDGVRDVRLLPTNPASQGLQLGRLKTRGAGWSYTVLKCPKCGHEGGGGNMKRYHFDACRSQTGINH